KANLRIPLHLSGFLRHDVCAHGLRGNHRSGTAKFLAVSESMKALSASSADGSMITLLHRPSPWSMMISFCVPSSMARACFRISGTVACTTGAFGCSPGGLLYPQARASMRDFNMIVAPFPLHGPAPRACIALDASDHPTCFPAETLSLLQLGGNCERRNNQRMSYRASGFTRPSTLRAPL